MKDKDKELTPDELREDLAARLPGLDQLAQIPGVIPTEEEPAVAPGEERFERVFGSGAPTPIQRREFYLVLALFALLAAIPLRAGLLRADRVTFGMDQALHSEPWSSVVRAEHGEVGMQNQGLSDQAVNFYPFYRWVSRSVLEGDLPLWNPLIYCGAPGLGNPQAGVLDPQVWFLIAGEAVGGLAGFHLALNWAALLRLLIAGVGAYFLARRLGLGWRGGTLAGISFQFSGYLVLWLNFPLGHVPPFLPWILYHIEGLLARGTTSPWPRIRAFVGAAACMCLAILGGHPETSFFVGLAAGLWSLAILRRERKAGWLSLAALALGSAITAPALLAFWRYLSRSGAMAIRSQAQEHVNLAPLALLLILGLGVAAVVVRRLWFASWAAFEDGGVQKAAGLVVVWLAALAFGTGGLLWLFGVGLEERAFLSLVHDYWGHPGRGGFVGPGTGLLENGSTWLVTAAWLGAAAALVGGAAGLRRRGLVIGVGAVALALALGVPGVLELYRQLPLVGLGDTVRFAPVAALMVGLLAGEGLERADLRARLLGLVPVSIAIVAIALTQQSEVAFTPKAGTGLAVEAADAEPWLTEVVLTEQPGALLDARLERLAGYFTGAGESSRARLVLTPTRADATELSMPLDFVARPPASPAPEGARFFRSSTFQTSRLEQGEWSLQIVFDGTGAEAPMVYDLGSALKLNTTDMSGLSWLWIALALGGFAAGRRGVPVVLVIAALQALHFAEGQNPTFDAALVFPETATEALLLEQLGDHRYFSELGVLPPDTGLVRGLRALDGYDAIDPQTYNEMRRFALQPGKHPLLAWHARGVDLTSPVFHMLGVKFLLFNGPLPARAGSEGWELVGRPGATGALRETEVWIYRARAPFPRVWGVTRATELRAEMVRLATPGAPRTWDPRETALLDAKSEWPWTRGADGVAVPDAPASRVAVSAVWFANNRAGAKVDVDGQALLVFSEQYFPGMHFEVDGEVREALRVNGLLSACPLRAGDREVVLVR